ncbi:MAG: polyphosphate kinase 2 family protein [Planctomycetaceae bacterium]
MPKPHRFDHDPYRIEPGTAVDLKKRSTGPPEEFAGRKQAKKALADDVSALAEAQQVLYADARFALLIIFQAMDAAGKDGTIRHVMSGVNPQGCTVQSFGPPSEEELGHHFLWRPMRFLPAKGRIGIFNRSYYEETLVVRVHPEYLKPQKLPPGHKPKKLWKQRFEDINGFEHTLTRSGTAILKFFLHVSKDEQKRRFLDRLNEPKKHWKFNAADLKERGHWDEYRHAFEEMLSATSTRWAPWYAIPADDKWFMRALVADIIAKRIGELDLRYPSVSEDDQAELAIAKESLLNEDD